MKEKPILKLYTFQKFAAFFSNEVRHFFLLSLIVQSIFLSPFAIFGSRKYRVKMKILLSDL